MFRLSLFVLFLGAGISWALDIKADLPIDEQVQAGDIFLDAGTRSILDQMGYGWGDNTHQVGWSGRWITHHEADILFEVAAVTNYRFTLRAEPALKMDKLQSIGLFINNRFVADWVCPYKASPKLYRCDVPASLLRLGSNKISLRIGYTTVPGGAEMRRLGLKVDYILMRPDA